VAGGQSWPVYRIPAPGSRIVRRHGARKYRPHGSRQCAGRGQGGQAAKVHELILRLANGYETQIGDGGAALSGGQRQRIALARAIFGEPKLIVLDEPNASLDYSGDNALVEAMNELSDNKVTTVIVTHRPSILRHVDKILVLHENGGAEFGPREEMFTKVTAPANGKPRGHLREVQNG